MIEEQWPVTDESQPSLSKFIGLIPNHFCSLKFDSKTSKYTYLRNYFIIIIYKCRAFISFCSVIYLWRCFNNLMFSLLVFPPLIPLIQFIAWTSVRRETKRRKIKSQSPHNRYHLRNWPYNKNWESQTLNFYP